MKNSQLEIDAIDGIEPYGGELVEVQGVLDFNPGRIFLHPSAAEPLRPTDVAAAHPAVLTTSSDELSLDDPRLRGWHGKAVSVIGIEYQHIDAEGLRSRGIDTFAIVLL